MLLLVKYMYMLTSIYDSCKLVIMSGRKKNCEESRQVAGLIIVKVAGWLLYARLELISFSRSF